MQAGADGLQQPAPLERAILKAGLPLDELLDWIGANRFVRDLTCEKRAEYRVEPYCK